MKLLCKAFTSLDRLDSRFVAWCWPIRPPLLARLRNSRRKNCSEPWLGRNLGSAGDNNHPLIAVLDVSMNLTITSMTASRINLRIGLRVSRRARARLYVDTQLVPLVTKVI